MKEFSVDFLDLHKLCSTLANVNLCEMVEDDHRSSSSSSRTTTHTFEQNSIDSSPMSSSPEFNSTMISGRSHLNELQKENRAPPTTSSFNSTPLSPNIRTSPSILSNTTPTLQNYQL